MCLTVSCVLVFHKQFPKFHSEQGRAAVNILWQINVFFVLQIASLV